MKIDFFAAFFKKFLQKPSSLRLSFIGIFIIVILLTISTNLGRKALEGKGSLLNIKNFDVVSYWKGTKGENAERFTVYKDLLLVCMGVDGIYIFDRDKLTMITNLAIETNEEKLSIKDIDTLNISNNVYFITTFIGSKGKTGFAVLREDFFTTNVEVNIYPIDFLSPISWCIVSNEIYVICKDKIIKKINFNGTEFVEKEQFKLSIDGECGKIKWEDGFFYIPMYENGLSIFKQKKDRIELLSTIKNQLNYVNNCYIQKNYLVISDRMLGVMIYNVSDKTKPKLIFRYDTSGDAFDISMPKNNEIFVTDGVNGVLKLDFNKNQYQLSRIFKNGEIAKNLLYDEKKNRLIVSFGVSGIYLLK